MDGMKNIVVNLPMKIRYIDKDGIKRITTIVKKVDDIYYNKKGKKFEFVKGFNVWYEAFKITISDFNEDGECESYTQLETYISLLNNYVPDGNHKGNYLEYMLPEVVFVEGVGYIDRRSDRNFYKKYKEIDGTFYEVDKTISIWRYNDKMEPTESEFVLKSDIKENSNKYWICPDCGQIYFSDNKPDVCRCHEITIYGYHSWKEELKFKKSRKEKNPVMFFGTEIETEGSKRNTRFVEQMKNVFHLEEDGSLGYGSFEMISMPMTWQYILDNKDKFAKMFEDLTKHGQKSHDTTHCGLHIHVSRAAFVSEFAIERFVCIINGLSDSMQVFARREDNSDDEDPCYFHYQYVGNKPNSDSFYDDVVTEGHHTAVNCGEHSDNDNCDTIEVRIFKGTLNLNTYLASIELVKNIVEVANNEHKMHITFKDLVYGEYVPAYVKLREENDNEFNYKEYIDFATWNIYELKGRKDLYKKFHNLLINSEGDDEANRRLLEKMIVKYYGGNK